MTHALYVWNDRAYDGELALARDAHVLDSDIAEKAVTLEQHPKLVFRVTHDDHAEFVTDPVDVYRLTKGHPEYQVYIIPVVS